MYGTGPRKTHRREKVPARTPVIKKFLIFCLGEKLQAQLFTGTQKDQTVRETTQGAVPDRIQRQSND
jgi:hypothetical protein